MKALIYPIPDVPVGQPPTGYEEIWQELPTGGSIVLWHRPTDDERPIVVFFHGNGENLETLKWSGLFDRLEDLGSAVVVEYPGYGRSSGSPSEASLKAAAEAALDWTRQQHPGRPVVAVGWSLGAALAVHLAASRANDIAGLVALSPWTSLDAVATAHFPRWLVALGLGERYDSLTAAGRVECAALVVHGRLDSIIPIEQGRALAAEIRDARWLEATAAGHNDLLGEPAVWMELAGFLAGIRPPPAAVK